MLTKVVALDPENDELIYACSDVFRAVGKLYSPDYAKFMARRGVMWAAVDEANKVLGVLATELWSAWDSKEWNPLLSEDRRLSTDPPALFLTDLGVAHGDRLKGVGTSLVQHAIDCSTFVDDGSKFNRVFAVSRVPPGGLPTSYGLLLRLGFAELAVAGRGYYWDADAWCCPDCGRHCNCAGHLMQWTRG